MTPESTDYCESNELTWSTSTVQANPPRYSDWLTNEIIDFVRDTESEQDAVSNLKVIMKEYERRKSFFTKLKQLFNK